MFGKRNKSLFFFFLLLAAGNLSAKVWLLTFPSHRPAYAVLQQKAFQRFLRDDYEVIVFHETEEGENRYVCAAQYAQAHFPSEDTVAILEEGFFPIRPFSLREAVAEKGSLVVQRDREEEPKIPFVAFPVKNAVQIDQFLQAETQNLSFASRDFAFVPSHFLKGFGFNQKEAKLISAIPHKLNLEFHLNNHFIYLMDTGFSEQAIKQRLKYVQIFFDTPPTESLEQQPVLEIIYDYICQLPCSECDIGEHLPALRELASRCPRVVELGVGRLNSTWGLLQGLAENPDPSRSYLGVDISPPPASTLRLLQHLAQKRGVPFHFLHASDLEIEIDSIDFLFIDSFHTYYHLTYELETFSPKVTQYIAMHDTSEPWGTLDEPYGGNYSEYPQAYDQKRRGLWAAVEDFLRTHPEWALHERYLNCHGFTILKRVEGRNGHF